MEKFQFIMVPKLSLSDELLNSTSKLLLGLIISLALKQDYCYATNKYLANHLNVSERTIKYALSNLKDLNYIIVNYKTKTRQIYINKDKLQINSLTGANSGNNMGEEFFTHNKNYKYKNKDNVITPKWLNEDIKYEEASEEEIKELKDLLSEYN